MAFINHRSFRTDKTKLYIILSNRGLIKVDNNGDWGFQYKGKALAFNSKNDAVNFVSFIKRHNDNIVKWTKVIPIGEVIKEN